MKVAINILPLKSGHKNRGIGFYTSSLIENLKLDPQIKVQEFINLNEVNDVDIVHYPFYDLFFHTLPVRKKFKTIVTIHDVIPLLFPEHYPVGIRGRYAIMLQKLSLKSCKGVITDSEISRSDISRYLSFNKGKISTVYLAPNKEFKIQSDNRLIHVGRKYNLPSRYLLYVGDANWVKNLPFLLKGFAGLLNKNVDFRDIKLIMVGQVFLKKVESINHPELESLKEANRLIKDLSLERNIIRPGDLNLDDLVSFYNLATVYIQPSMYEGFGFPLVEAFACGTPVLSSDRGSLPEIGGDAAVYFNPTNLNKFVSELELILRDNSLRSSLSKLGLKRSKEFSWRKVANETKSIYQKIIST